MAATHNMLDLGPPGITPTGVDVAWAMQNAERVVRVALLNENMDWEKLEKKQQERWIANFEMFAEALMQIASKRSVPSLVPKKEPVKEANKGS